MLLNQSLSHGLLAVQLVSNGRLCSPCQKSFPQGGVDVVTKKAYFMLLFRHWEHSALLFRLGAQPPRFPGFGFGRQVILPLSPEAQVCLPFESCLSPFGRRRLSSDGARGEHVRAVALGVATSLLSRGHADHSKCLPPVVPATQVRHRFISKRNLCNVTSPTFSCSRSGTDQSRVRMLGCL